MDDKKLKEISDIREEIIDIELIIKLLKKVNKRDNYIQFTNHSKDLIDITYPDKPGHRVIFESTYNIIKECSIEGLIKRLEKLKAKFKEL